MAVGSAQPLAHRLCPVLFLACACSRGSVRADGPSVPSPRSSRPDTAPGGTARVSRGSGISGASAGRVETGRRRASEPGCARWRLVDRGPHWRWPRGNDGSFPSVGCRCALKGAGHASDRVDPDASEATGGACPSLFSPLQAGPDAVLNGLIWTVFAHILRTIVQNGPEKVSSESLRTLAVEWIGETGFEPAT